MNIRSELEARLGADPEIRLNDVEVDPNAIRAVLINEVVPADPAQDFYGGDGAAYLSTTIPLFRQSGLPVKSMDDILRLGIYITNAAKTPKTAYAVEKENIERSLPYLEQELSLFPNLRVIMLMGDVARKMFNLIARKQTHRNVIPSGATYKLRGTPFYLGNVRVMPSYIITGGNLLIEKGKTAMISQDITCMAELIRP